MNLENRKAGERETRPTPETDAAKRHKHNVMLPHEVVPAFVCERIERQRDVARELCDFNAKQLLVAVNERNSLVVQRDRLLAALKALIDAPDYRKLSEFSQQELAAWAEARQAVAAVEGSAS